MEIPWMVLQPTAGASILGVLWEHLSMCIMLDTYLRYVSFAQLLRNLIIFLEKKHCTSTVTLQVPVVTSITEVQHLPKKVLHAILSVTTVVGIWCKIHKCPQVELWKCLEK